MDQRTEEWFQARLGKVTASGVSKVMSKGAERVNYMAQLVAERLTKKPQEAFSNAAMQWGTEQEPFARAAYEAHRGVLVEEVGFIVHPTIQDAGASPDGLVEEGMVEIKCPNTATMIDVLLTKKIDPKYIHQMQWQMACAQRPWVDYVVFDPRLEKIGFFCQRVERNPSLIEEMEEAVKKFLTEVDEKVAKLEEMWQKP